MRQTWTFHSAGQVLFGPGAAAQLGQVVARLGAQRVLLVTDRPLVEAGLLDAVVGPLSEAKLDCETFADGEPEPSLSVAAACVQAARRFGPDCLLGLGGGSNMDLAKVAAVVLSHGGSCRDYFGEEQVPGPVMPLVCVPTTAGTGSEVTHAAVLTDEEHHIKVSTLSNFLRPRAAVVDPRLTRSCPRKVTADSGIDALTHAVEAYTAIDNAAFPVPDGGVTAYQGRNLLSDSLAEQAVRLIVAHLPRAVAEPDNLPAREGMALAALLAGLAFSNSGVALVHALEYPVGGAVHCSHGAGNGLLLPHVMRFNLPAQPRQFARLAELLGQPVAGLSEAEAGQRAIEAVEQLARAVGIPARLRDLGVGETQLAGFADKAFAIRRLLRVNPRSATRDDLVGIYQAAF